VSLVGAGVTSTAALLLVGCSRGRELAEVLSERFEAREKARSRASKPQPEAAVLAPEPDRSASACGCISWLSRCPSHGRRHASRRNRRLLIFGCYLLMHRLGRLPEPRPTGEGG
jgi:hypothetical protein